MNYVIATGYYEHPGSEEFFRIWHDNTVKNTSPKAIYVINASPKEIDYGQCRWLNMTDNLGHIQRMASGQKLSGWSMSVLLGCLTAYHCFADLIYKEQDCLAFGDWINVLDRECPRDGMLVGKKNTNGGGCGLTAQSLLLIRHGFLLDFVTKFLGLPETDRQVFPESKFDRILEQCPDRIQRMSMGYDRSRPVQWSDEAFYMQQCNAADLNDLRGQGLID